MQRVLQSETKLTTKCNRNYYNVTGITKHNSYYKVRRNTSKINIIILLCPERKTISKYPNSRIREPNVNPSKNIRYLGIILDEHLDWNECFNSLVH